MMSALRSFALARSGESAATGHVSRRPRRTNRSAGPCRDSGNCRNRPSLDRGRAIASQSDQSGTRPNVGHESDYSWITGQIRIENGQHVIHYAAPEVVDAHNAAWY